MEKKGRAPMQLFEVILSTALFVVCIVIFSSLELADDLSFIPSTIISRRFSIENQTKSTAESSTVKDENLPVTTTLPEVPDFMERLQLDPVVTFPVKVKKLTKKCEGDCQLFQKRLATWPSGNVKAAFCYLFNGKRATWMQASLDHLYQNVNQRYAYPVIIFYQEEDFSKLEPIIMNSQNKVYLQSVQFEPPDFLLREIPQEIPCNRNVGYRIMCEFQAKKIYDEPILNELDYIFTD
jgi:hypothetical protein